MARDDDQFKVRLPAGMRDEIHAAAAANNRSANAEMVHRLQTYSNPEGADVAKGNTLTIRISDETKATLDRLSARGPYRISMTSIVERGIELAALELSALGGIHG